MFCFTEPPTEPRDLNVTAESSRVIRFSWLLPDEDGGRDDLYYQVEYSDPDDLGTYIGTMYLSGGSTSHSFSDLRPYTQYCVRVTAPTGVSDQDPDGTHLRTVEKCIRTPEDSE